MREWFRQTVGIALNDGVDELDATAAFEVYTQSAAARTVALATGDTVRTRHGLTLLTTSTSDAPSLSRVIVPGAAPVDARLQRWAAGRHLDVQPLRRVVAGGGADMRGGGGFTAALQDLTEHSDATTASSTAKMIGYPVSGVNLQGGHTAVRTILLAVSSLALAVLIGRGPACVGRRRRRLSASSATTMA